MRLLRLQDVIEITGLSRASIYRYEARGEFPKRRQVGPNTVRWLDEDLLEWMKSRPPATETVDAANLFGHFPAPSKH